MAASTLLLLAWAASKADAPSPTLSHTNMAGMGSVGTSLVHGGLESVIRKIGNPTDRVGAQTGGFSAWLMDRRYRELARTIRKAAPEQPVDSFLAGLGLHWKPFASNALVRKRMARSEWDSISPQAYAALNAVWDARRAEILRGVDAAPLDMADVALTPIDVDAGMAPEVTPGGVGIWAGNGADGQWSTTGNWGGLVVPGSIGSSASTDVATFNAPIVNTWGNLAGNPVVIDSGRNIGGINFDAAAGNYFIGSTGGNALLLSSGGTIQILSTLTATNAVHTVNAPLVLEGNGGNYTLANNSANGTGAGAGTLNIGGGITGGNAGATVLTLSGNNTNANTLSGIIADGSATSVSLTKTGTGTWILTGANTYGGGTNIDAGTLVVQNGSGLSSRGVSVASGASLVLQGSFAVQNLLSISGSGAAGQSGALSSSTSDNIYCGNAILLEADATISSDRGMLTLSDEIRADGSGFNLTLTGAGSGMIAGTLINGSGGVIKNGSGVWNLDIGSAGYGSTTVNAGTLNFIEGVYQTTAFIVNGGILNTQVSGGFLSISPLTLGGGTFTYSGEGGPSNRTESMSSLTLLPGTASGITVNNENSPATTAIQFSPTFSRGADSVVDITYTPGEGSGAAVTASSVPNGTGAPTGTNKIFGYVLVTDTSGVTGLGQFNSSNEIVRFNSQANATTLTGSSNSATTDYTTYNTVYTAGLLDWSNRGSLGARSANSLTIDTTNNGGSILLGGDPGSTGPGGAAVLTLASGALVFQGAKNETIYGGQIGATNSEVDIHQLGSGTLTLGGVLTGGTGSVLKDGPGTLVLTGQSTQTGEVLGPIVGNLSDITGLYVGEAVSGNGISAGGYIELILDPHNIQVTGSTNGSGLPTPITFGTQNSYTGGTYIDAGTVQAGGANALSPNSAVIMANAAGATLDLNSFNNQIGSLTGGGPLGGNVTLGTATLTVGSDNTSPAAYAGVISGSGGSLAKIGTGTLILAGVNTYTGATTVSQGTLLVSGSISGSTTTVTNAGSALGGTGTVGGVNVGSGAILEGGNGSSASGALTSAGNISLASGSLIELTLGPGGTTSSLDRTGGTWSFASNQAFTFTLTSGVTVGTYDDLITGLTGSEAGLATIGNWTISNPGMTGTFFYDGAGNVDLTVAAIPEPGAAALLLAALPLLGMRRRKGASLYSSAPCKQ